MTSQPTHQRARSWSATLRAAIGVLVHSSLFVSLAATSVAVTTTLLADLPLDPVPLAIVFAATLFVYGLDRVIGIEVDRRNVPGRVAFTQRYGTAVLVAGSLLYLAVAALAVARDVSGAVFLVAPPAVAAAYSLLRLKRILLVKNLVVGFAWGAIPLGVGVYHGALPRIEVLALFGVVTAMVTVAAVLFDVKDVEGDRAAGIRTVPIAIGPRATRVVAAATTVAVAVGVVTAVAVGALPGTFLVLLAFFAYVLAYVPFATPERGTLFYGFVVDGEHVFLAAVVLAMEAL